jgi:hypothetical protein
MAGIGKKTLKAASILESIVAMMIIMIALGIGVMVFTRFAFPAMGMQGERAARLLDQQLQRIDRSPTPFQVDTLISGLRLTATVTPYKGYRQVWLVKAQAIDQQEQVIARKQVLIIKH